MKALDTNLPSSSRRGPVRMDTQDGPWSVSVAETPYDSHSYSLYIKTPTHNLTLTRTAMELVELDLKLRQSHSNVKIPQLPIHPDSLPLPPPKRKSTFLNTLSRLASPTAAKANRRAQNASILPNSSSLPTPITTPSREGGDPFGSFTSASSAGDSPTDHGVADNATASPAPNSPSAAIAAYLTTVSNTPPLRMDRLWKRFVRVRTDDLESVRVERAIKRVRSDLAAHTGLAEKENAKSISSVSLAPSSIHEKQEFEDTIREEEEPVDRHPSKADNATDSTTTQSPPSDTTADNSGTSKMDDAAATPPAASDPAVDATATTPIAVEPPVSNRMHRSQSAEPDKSHRLSRAYTSSAPSQSGAESQTTGDEESSSSAAAVGGGKRRRKKHSVPSTKRHKENVVKEPKKSQRKVVIDDFEMMRVLGKGCAGKVLLVRHKTTEDLFALKAITKRHVLAHQELQHTLTEQAVLKRMAAESRDPFVVKLWWSFHDKDNLFLVMDFHPGGDLATQLARWGRLGRDRARFYAAEIVEGVEGLHAAGVIYRDLKPENILIGADGHIVLTDFGLSKEFPRHRNHHNSTTHSNSNNNSQTSSHGSEFYSSVPGAPQPATPPWMKPDRAGELALGWPGQPVGHTDSTSTFCGTAEYLAPEVIQGLPYSYEVDWWSFGTMLYEMLTGVTPFWANNHSDMYVRVLQDELQFPDDRAIDQDTKSLIRGLLQRVPSLRICEPRIKKHPYFSMIDWSHVYYKRYIPPYIPPIDPSNASDTQNFDDTFLDMEPVLDEFNDEATDTDQEPQTDADRTDGDDTNTTPSQSRSSSIRPQLKQQQQQQPPTPAAEEDDVDVFDGYSFKGRHSVLIDDEEEEEEEVSGSDEVDESTDEEKVGDQDLAVLQGLERQQSDALEEQSVEGAETEDGGEQEPKTPEARPAPALPPVVEDVAPVAPVTEKRAEEEIKQVPRTEEPPPVPAAPTVEQVAKPPATSLPTHVATATVAPSSTETSGRTTPPSSKIAALVASRLPANARTARPRKERSGVPALDRYLSDAVDEDTEMTEAERDEDEDWDFIEAADGEDRNGAKGTSLFARGVVDRYRLAVFRKASTPNSRAGQRSFSGMSAGSTATEIESPSPTQRRGRTPGLTFRKHPRQFLRPKSPPPSSFSAKSARSVSASASNSNTSTMSAASAASAALLTPSLSVGSSTFALPHSLKSKESATSVGAQSHSSGQSGNGQSAVFVEMTDTIRTSPPQVNGREPKPPKSKKLKKYKNNAEKVFSLFSSPRQTTS
ncbi:hypothetical protein M413DRAFT_22065 [Hebeloma cylindrosporum]|uniref:non-specific serine/threonine protein kinase n=1 Tax=Hebeloma cylindrosporum TaxID=76867 RepID=A0A0C3CTF6_HEBCY|nr:hypothetical protein M413DRAFT_22065 [Hebeloma cylindrosporum h7]